MSQFYFSDRSNERMEGIHRDIKMIARVAIRRSPVDFGIPPDGGIRTAARQYELHQNGKSKADGYDRLSRHQSGEALDVYAIDPVTGKASWDPILLSIIAGVFYAVATELYTEGLITHQIRWGGTFGTKGRRFDGWDKPHFELIKVE